MGSWSVSSQELCFRPVCGQAVQMMSSPILEPARTPGSTNRHTYRTFLHPRPRFRVLDPPFTRRSNSTTFLVF